jgi:hypothetical protein
VRNAQIGFLIKTAYKSEEVTVIAAENHACKLVFKGLSEKGGSQDIVKQAHNQALSFR